MYLKRVQIRNYRNFAALDVQLTKNVVMIGENRVGKSNFICALRLVLDITLPDSARQLKLTDIWDSCDLTNDPKVEIHLDFADFDSDTDLLALLTDYRLATDHTLARLSYVFRKKSEVTGDPRSEADFEFVVYGGGDETRAVKSDVRRRICLDILHALRDAEGDLGAWRSSPLRPLLEHAIAGVSRDDLDVVADDVNQATRKLGALPPIKTLETDLRRQIADLAGTSQDIRTKLGFAPTDPLRLFRSIGLFIDDGKRGIAEASLGSANLALLTLKLAEFDWRRNQKERNYTLVCVEEPEAHLHPHLQRTVFQKLFSENTDELRGLFLTTHSPNIASVVPLSSIIVLKNCAAQGTKAFSLAELSLEPTELEDLQRYLDTTRADILFSRGVIFVEGDAEVALLPVFAKSCGYDLDALGITVCSVGGINFSPYVKLATALALPFVVVTDWDPLDGSKAPLGRKRAVDLVADIRKIRKQPPCDPSAIKKAEADDALLKRSVKHYGIFLNNDTLETEIAYTITLVAPLLAILEAENFGPTRRKRLTQWKADPSTVNGEQLLAMIADIGKGRLAGRLADQAAGLTPPVYIADALHQIVSHV